MGIITNILKKIDKYRHPFKKEDKFVQDDDLLDGKSFAPVGLEQLVKGNDIKKSNVYRRTWFYNEILELFDQYKREVFADWVKDAKIKRKAGRDWRKIRKAQGVFTEEGKVHVNYLKDQIEKGFQDSTSARDRRLSDIENQRELHLQQKCFLIGPATLDSLLNQEPKSYEYVRNFRLPFEKMFFEFYEPVNLAIPFLDKIEPARAVVFQKISEDGKFNYNLQIYYGNIPRIMKLSMEVNPSNPEVYMGMVADFASLNSPVNGSGPTTVFFIDRRVGKIFYDDANKIYQGILKNIDPKDYAIFMQSAMKDSKLRSLVLSQQKSFNEFEQKDIFTQIPNLCVNLVNYINSHNTTVIEAKRPTRRISPNNRELDEPFYLITVRDKTVSEYEPPEDSVWTFKYRIYVMGHNRTLRHEKYTKSSTWVKPYIKGPSDAPFKDQRHIILAEKLYREQAMYKDLGIK